MFLVRGQCRLAGDFDAGNEGHALRTRCTMTLMPTCGGVVVGKRPEANPFTVHQCCHFGHRVLAIAVERMRVQIVVLGPHDEAFRWVSFKPRFKTGRPNQAGRAGRGRSAVMVKTMAEVWGVQQRGRPNQARSCLLIRRRVPEDRLRPLR